MYNAKLQMKDITTHTQLNTWSGSTENLLGGVSTAQ